IALQKSKGKGAWETMATGVTNADGRIPDLAKDKIIKPGMYQMIFDTGTYFKSQKVKSFYPVVRVVFEISDKTHHHIPLLLSPFGYSTYRGS
ncbi:MAG TPA: hydroxyisourate hydrolase, partial [Cyclobacteriaceae bacterium]|nr:hydroxyisourate hydrolase [Cyclobacteriaceae bacterium]